MPFRIPNKGMRCGISGKVGFPNNLPFIIQCRSEAANAAEGAQVDHPAFFPEERILRRDILPALSSDWAGFVTGVGNTSDLATFIHPSCQRVGTAQITQVSHFALLPEEGA